MIAIIITTMITKIVIIMITPPVSHQRMRPGWAALQESQTVKSKFTRLQEKSKFTRRKSYENKHLHHRHHCIVLLSFIVTRWGEPELSVKFLWKFTSFLNREQCYFCFGKKVRSNKTQKRTLCQCLLLIHNLSDLKGFKKHSYHLYWVWRHQFNGWTQNFQRKVKVQLSRFDRQQNLDLAKNCWSTQITAFGIFWV